MGIGKEPLILEVDANNLFVFNVKAGKSIVRRLLGTKKLIAMKLQR
jgi:hypothetical protein